MECRYPGGAAMCSGTWFPAALQAPPAQWPPTPHLAPLHCRLSGNVLVHAPCGVLAAVVRRVAVVDSHKLRRQAVYGRV